MSQEPSAPNLRARQEAGRPAGEPAGVTPQASSPGQGSGLDSGSASGSASELTSGLVIHEGPVFERRASSMETLELNLMHLGATLEQSALRLNKPGTPHRRGLGKLVAGLIMPSASGMSAQAAQAAPEALDPERLDYLAFLMALGMELGMFGPDTSREHARAHQEASKRYFMHPEERRNRALQAATRNLKHWSEIISAEIARSPLALHESQIEAQLSLTQPNGTPLIGARGYLLSVMRRVDLRRWVPTQALITVCIELDRDYLPRVIERAHSALEPGVYVRMVVEHMLFWLGVVELARDDQGQGLVRLTPRGQRWLEIAQPEPEPEPSSPACFIVQPNQELMVFLDAAPLQVLYTLYELTQRVGIADRVATFRLSSESIQRGYSLGWDASQVITFLEERGHTPLDATTRFQLEDWQRRWQRLTLYADGLLLRHPDPEALDLILGHLKHQWMTLERSPEVVRISHGSAFISGAELGSMWRVLARYPHLVLDYLGTLPPSLAFEDEQDPLRFELRALECDLLTQQLVQRVASLDASRSTPTRRRYVLEPEALRAYVKASTFGELLAALKPRCLGGMPPMTELRLHVLLEPRRASEAKLTRDVVLLQLSSPEQAKLLGQIPEAQALIVERLGERAFSVRAEDEARLRALLDRVGLSLEDDSP